MKGSIVIAAALAVGAAAWIASGQLDEEGRRAVAEEGKRTIAETGPAQAPLVSVRIRETVARPRKREIVINGRTEESRRVTLRAQTAGPVTAVPAREGQAIKLGDVVARQDVENREALLKEAEALVRQRRIEHTAAARLAKKGFRANTQLAGARARLDAALARTEAARIDMDRTTLRAPFAGVLESRTVEVGAYAKSGDRIATIVDLDPILAIGYASERDVAGIRVGAQGSVRLVDGRTVSGAVRYVASIGESQTRSFRVELEISNPDLTIRAGLTCKLRLPLPATNAHLISPAVLTLADDGRVGVRIVDAGDVARFVPVEILADSEEGVWVSGLEHGDRLITVGHEFVKDGQKVRPVAESAETAS